jgi:hypothetical protein
MTGNEIIKDLQEVTCNRVFSEDEIATVIVKQDFLKDILDLINCQKAEIDNLEYTLLGVMHFVDKWLDGDELEQDEVNRAEIMRNRTLKIIEEQQAEIDRLKRFKAYFDDLYGDGLEVANWHLNGKLEPFDNFYESAIAEMAGEG